MKTHPRPTLQQLRHVARRGATTPPVSVIRATRKFILLLALVATLVACGGPASECPANVSCRANGTAEAFDATQRVSEHPIGTATSGTPPPVRDPINLTPSPEPPIATSAPPTAIPPETPTLIPPDPSQLTPRPTDPPLTPRPRPRLPAASDIQVGPDGKYVANVDGCQWTEFGRFPVANSADITVGMQTSCLPYEGLHFNPRTGEIDYFIA